MREKFKPPQGKITLEVLQSLLKGMPYIKGICIMGLCEPLLSNELPNMLRWLKDEGHYSISLTTNGMVPINEDMLDALTRVDDFVFLVDTARAAKALGDLVDKRVTGLVHVCGDKKMSMYEFAKLTDPDVKPITLQDYRGPPLTVNMSLTSKRIPLVSFDARPVRKEHRG